MRRDDRIRLMRSIQCALFGTPDRARWSDLANHDQLWDERTQLVASLIPRGSRVIEFGAGRRQLERYLDPSCSYVPSDLVSRGPDTLVCDLNVRPLPDLSNVGADVAVFGGVFEYVANLDSVIQWVARHVSVCVASYEVAATRAWTAARQRERLVRAQIGWVNAYTEDELARLFENAGFRSEQKLVWHTSGGDEPLFVFRKNTRE
jgi:Methyltransferase domain